jgi:hypothetical protein
MTNFSAFVLKRDNEILEEFNRLLDKNYKLDQIIEHFNRKGIMLNESILGSIGSTAKGLVAGLGHVGEQNIKGILNIISGAAKGSAGGAFGLTRAGLGAIETGVGLPIGAISNDWALIDMGSSEVKKGLYSASSSLLSGLSQIGKGAGQIVASPVTGAIRMFQAARQPGFGKQPGSELSQYFGLGRKSRPGDMEEESPEETESPIPERGSHKKDPIISNGVEALRVLLSQEEFGNNALILSYIPPEDGDRIYSFRVNELIEKIKEMVDKINSMEGSNKKEQKNKYKNLKPAVEQMLKRIINTYGRDYSLYFREHSSQI